MKRTLLAILSLIVLVIIAAPTGAQDGNLLQDPGFEGAYSNRGAADLNVSAPWNLTVVTTPHTQDWMNLQPTAFPHNGPGPNPHSGAHAQNFNRGYATFTVALYQTVPATSGTNYTASAWAQIKTCNIPSGADNCASSGDSGAYVRVGISPNGSTNVYDSGIVWSANAAPHDNWQQVTTTATATGGSITIFLFATQNLPAQLNKLYWDDAYLGTGGAGGAAPGSAPAVPPTPTPLPYVPFVQPQPPQPDGSIVHTVGPGDTLDSIAYAYGMTRDQVLALNPQIHDARYILQGQRIIIRPPQAGGSGGEPSGAATAEPGTGETSVPAATLPPSAPIVAPNQPVTATHLGIVGGSAGLSGYFPPQTVRSSSMEIRPPTLALASPGSVHAALPARSTTTTEIAVTTAGRTPADFNVGSRAPIKFLARRQPDPTPTSSDGLREPVQASDSAPAPVQVVGADVPPALDPVSITSSVCVLMFEDSNRNRIQELGENLLAGALITLTPDGDAPLTYTTDGTNEPHCFGGLPAGTMIASAQPPANYGLTTPDQFVVQTQDGTQVTIMFGAAQGVIPVQPPPADSPVSQIHTSVPVATPTIRDNLGVLAISAAVFILIGGMVLTLLLRRRF